MKRIKDAMIRKFPVGRTLAAGVFASVLLVACGQEAPDDMLASAKAYLAKDDDRAAVIQLKNALQKDPSLVEARFLLGQALLQTGDAVGAEIELRRALELGYSPAQVNPVLARALLGLGQHRKVVDDFANAEADSPESKAVLYTAVGRAHLALREINEAQASFDKALASSPGYPPAVLSSAYIKAGRRDLPGALALVDDAIKASPKMVDAHQFRAELLVALGKSEAALESYRRALEVNAKHLPAHSAIAGLLIQQDKHEEADKQLQAMQKVAPKHPQTSYVSALLNYRQKKLAAARESIQQHLRASPDNAPGLVLAAAIEQDLKAYAQSEAHLQKAIQQSPNFLPARLFLVSNYLKSGQQDKAMDAVTPLLASGGNNPVILAMAGEVYLVNNRPKEAAQYFEKASTLDPDDEQKKTGLALSHLAQGNTEQGLRELEQAAAGSSDTRADLALIATHLKNRNFDQALVAIDALDKKRPEEALTHNLRGTALIGKNDVAGARRSFERALSIDNAYFPAAANLARLDLAEKKPQDAKKRFDAVLAANPRSTQAMLALAELRLREKGKPEEVAALIGKAINVNPSDLPSRLAMIAHHLRNKDPAKAVTAAQEALVAIPDRPELLHAAGRAQAAAGSTNQALATYRKWEQVQPKSPLPLLRIAELQIEDKDIPAATRSLRRALELDPNLLEAQRALVAIEAQSGRIKEAVAVARAVQSGRPDESIGYVLEGDAYASQKQYKQALAAFRKGLQQTDTGILAARVDGTLRRDGKRADADAFAAGWLKEHPKDSTFLLYLAQAATQQSDFKTAARHYGALVALHPNNAAYLNNLAWAGSRINDPQALANAEKAVQLAPDQPALLDTLGTILVEKGETARGVETLQRAVKLAPDAAQIRLNLAKGLLQAGRKDEARQELNTLAKLGDRFRGHEEVKKLASTL